MSSLFKLSNPFVDPEPQQSPDPNPDVAEELTDGNAEQSKEPTDGEEPDSEVELEPKEKDEAVKNERKPKQYTNPLTKKVWSAARRQDVVSYIEENGGKWPVKNTDPDINLQEYLAGSVFTWEHTKQIQILVQRPLRRELDIREGRTVALLRQQNVEAAVAFLVGKMHSKGCGHCKKGNGPFTGCVTVNNALRGACANCHYGGEGSRCEYHESTHAKEVKQAAQGLASPTTRKGSRTSQKVVHYPPTKRVRPAIDLTDERPSKKAALQKFAAAITAELEDEESESPTVKKGKKDSRKAVKVEAVSEGNGQGNKGLLRDAMGMSKQEATTFAVQLSRLSAALFSELQG